MGVLTKQELDYLEENLRRKANEIEQDIVGAENIGEPCAHFGQDRTKVAGLGGIELAHYRCRPFHIQ